VSLSSRPTTGWSERERSSAFQREERLGIGDELEAKCSSIEADTGLFSHFFRRWLEPTSKEMLSSTRRDSTRSVPSWKSLFCRREGARSRAELTFFCFLF